MKLTSLIRFLKVPSDSDNLIDISSFGPNGRAKVGQAVFAISNSPKSRYDEIMVSKMILRIGNSK